ncbi:MAG: hypothetical protein GC158_06385 [Cyanobacteria bacterium RI_101]|nr:hypothetical protein [Cyanobacteria bacterium RI_101]
MNPWRRNLSARTYRPAPFPGTTLWLAPLALLLGVGSAVGAGGFWLSSQSVVQLTVPPVVARNKRPRLFEIRGRQIYYLDTAAIQRQLTDFGQRLPICKPPERKGLESSLRARRYYFDRLGEFQACQRNQNRELQSFRAATEFYQVRLQGGPAPALRYDLALPPEDERDKTLDEWEANFRRRLAQFDPQKEYLAFIVRPDGFGAFRQARRLAQSQGFEVGWEPLTGADPLLLGAQGQTVGGL